MPAILGAAIDSPRAADLELPKPSLDKAVFQKDVSDTWGSDKLPASGRVGTKKASSL